MCATSLKGLFLAWSVLSAVSAQPDVATTLKKIRECIASDQATLCLKERALDALNETVMSDKPMNIYGVIDIVRDPQYVMPNSADDNFLPRDLKERSEKLNDMLLDKVDDFLGSRSIQIHLGKIIEGRGKKDKNKGGMLMMGGLAMAGMMAQLFMGKIAFMAGAALLLAKLALMLSTVIGFKKLSGGGGGGDVALRKSLLALGGLAVAGMMIQKFVGLAWFFKASSSVVFLKLVFLALATYTSQKKNKPFKLKNLF